MELPQLAADPTLTLPSGSARGYRDIKVGGVMLFQKKSVEGVEAPVFDADDKGALRHLGQHAAIIVVLALWVGVGLPLWGLMLVPLGIALAALSSLQHECVHGTPFKVAWLNTLVGTVTGFVLFQPFQWYRLDHFEQHRRRSIRNTLDERPETEKELWIYLSSIHFWRERLDVLLENGGGLEESEFIREDQFPRLRREAQLMLLLYVYAVAFTMFIWPILFWVWFLPVALGMPVIRLFELAVSRDMFDNGRDTQIHRVIKFFTWNTSYTAEHYAMPDVPYYKLPELHARANPRRSRSEDGGERGTATA